MYDTTIHPRTLQRHLRATDFYSDPRLFNAAHKNAELARAHEFAARGFPPTTLSSSVLRGNRIYQFTDIAEELVIRHVTSNVRRITSVKQDDRSLIVRCINTLASQGTPFNIYKFDIKSFYESVDVNAILDKLSDDVAFSGQSARALTSFFRQLNLAGINGLPRGLSLSATLAEYLMREFDQAVSSWSGVWYYARFVDDILVITSGREDTGLFMKAVAAKLPSGLRLNRKSNAFPFAKHQKGNMSHSEGVFNFLGYQFDVSRAWRDSTNKIVRTVKVDIAPSKVRKIKTRLAKSLIAFGSDLRFVDLRDRVRMLTSNVVYVDYKTDVRRASGLAFNYPLVSDPAAPSLKELDKFLRSSLMSPHPKNKLYQPALTQAQRRELAGLSFESGFARRRFFSIPTGRLMALARVWAYV